MSRRMIGLLLVLALWSISLAPLALAQTAAATIVGTVVDPRGAVVAGANVVARNTETGIERNTQTTSDGLYRFDNLPPGVYDVRVQAQGFSAAELKAVK